MPPAAKRSAGDKAHRGKKKAAEPAVGRKEAQRKYCRCLMRVRATGVDSPYGICHASVLTRRGLPRPRHCDFRFEEFTYAQLLAYARELQGRKRSPLAPLTGRAAQGSVAALARVLRAHAEAGKKARRAASKP
jgi:hypothetical protein